MPCRDSPKSNFAKLEAIQSVLWMIASFSEWKCELDLFKAIVVSIMRDEWNKASRESIIQGGFVHFLDVKRPSE